MADQTIDEVKKAKPTAIEYVKAWGEAPVAPAILATLIAAQHLQPPQALPLLFPPVLLFSTYLSLNGHKKDAAGTSAAWSGLYLLLASRRKQRFMKKWGVRGVIRGTTMGMCALNLVTGGFVYAMAKRDKAASDDEGLSIK